MAMENSAGEKDLVAYVVTIADIEFKPACKTKQLAGELISRLRVIKQNVHDHQMLQIALRDRYKSGAVASIAVC